MKFFDYPSMPMNGSTYTVFNFRRAVDWGTGLSQAGSSWRMIVNFDRNYCIIPGGNSGNYFSPTTTINLKCGRMDSTKNSIST